MKKELGIRDVMVGDWVDVRVAAAPDMPHIERLDPSNFLREEKWYGIPLTPDIVANNGLNAHTSDKYVLSVVFIQGKVMVSLCANRMAMSIGWRDVIYVHELQHILRLCGIKLEIDLNK